MKNPEKNHFMLHKFHMKMVDKLKTDEINKFAAMCENIYSKHSLASVFEDVMEYQDKKDKVYNHA